MDSVDITAVNEFLQSKLLAERLEEVPAVEAAVWLDRSGLLKDRIDRPGLPLRRLLRGGLIAGQIQRPERPNGRWFIRNLGATLSPEDLSGDQENVPRVRESHRSLVLSASEVDEHAATGSPSREKDLERFYELLSELEQVAGGKRRLAECDGRMDWPTRGVYFFFEIGESRSSAAGVLRVVRVGTHALKRNSGTKLWTRLSQHRGQVRSGGGNHRGSIFRLLVGSALMSRDGLVYPTWDQGSSAPRKVRVKELPLEQSVSRVIGRMPFLWLTINDEPGPDSLRGYIERNSIALLSNFNRLSLDPPSSAWLGGRCNRERVRRSGLWNQNHVDEAYDRAFLDVFERLVNAM